MALIIQLYFGDNRSKLKTILDNSIDSVVTDPPYEIGFMGKSWDATGIAYDPRVWQECLRVMKPGAHLLAFGSPRTYHRLACAIEDAGFEIRDQVMWLFGSGFGKGSDVGKAIDKAAGVEREVVGSRITGAAMSSRESGEDLGTGGTGFGSGQNEVAITAPATPEAAQWNGWATLLKPAHEPLVLARKPLEGTVAQNILKWGVGALNVDACRVEADDQYHSGYHSQETKVQGQVYGWAQSEKFVRGEPHDKGRWPANIIHDGNVEFPEVSSGGTAAKFFYCAKASKRDRDEGCEGMELKQTTGGGGMNDPNGDNVCGKYGSVKSPSRNHHPTVKPTDLMRYLVRLVTPPGGVMLDPFMGSGSTGKAAIYEECNFTGIELNAEFIEISVARMMFALNKTNQEAIWQSE